MRTQIHIETTFTFPEGMTFYNKDGTSIRNKEWHWQYVTNQPNDSCHVIVKVSDNWFVAIPVAPGYHQTGFGDSNYVDSWLKWTKFHTDKLITNKE